MSLPYTLALGPASGSVPTQEVTTFSDWSLTRNLDDGCTLSISMMGNSLPGVLMLELETDLFLYRSGVLIDRFRVVTVSNEWGENGEHRLSVGAVCYRRLLAARHVITPLTYVATSQGDIVWGLIQHTQAQTNGSLGITLGSAGPSIPRDRAYPPGQNILEAIVDLSQIDGGLTWDVDANRQLIVSIPSSYPVRAQPVQMGTNARKLAKPSGSDLFANVALVSGDTQTTVLEVEQAATLPLDPRGRWERFRAFPQEASQTALDEQARGILEETQSPLVVWSFDLVPDRYLTDSDYALGDFVTIVRPATVVPGTPDPTIPYLTVPGGSVLTQILTISLRVDADGNLDVSMTAIESPAP
jgi:hypothetical protein